MGEDFWASMVQRELVHIVNNVCHAKSFENSTGTVEQLPMHHSINTAKIADY